MTEIQKEITSNHVKNFENFKGGGTRVNLEMERKVLAG